jgi:hypothetical protein
MKIGFFYTNTEINFCNILLTTHTTTLLFPSPTNKKGIMCSAGSTMDDLKTGTATYMSLYPEASTDGALRLGNIVPDFSCETTQGNWDSFHEWKKGKVIETNIVILLYHLSIAFLVCLIVVLYCCSGPFYSATPQTSLQFVLQKSVVWL